MKQPDSIDVGTQMDVVRHLLNVAREDLETAHLTFEAEQYRGANNKAYYSIFHTICAVLAKERVLLNAIRIHLAILIKIMCNQKFFHVN
mgnify:CR=1 FL=1